MPADAFDFLAFCRPGMTLKTRDRRDARILAVGGESGVISGEVQMLGACEWRADGRYRQAPAGAAGPWDLIPPAVERGGDLVHEHESIAAALGKPEPSPGCCD